MRTADEIHNDPEVVSAWKWMRSAYAEYDRAVSRAMARDTSPRPYVTNEDVVRVLEYAVDRFEEEGSFECRRDAIDLRVAIRIVKTLPESYIEATGTINET
jgi:hypothetical protein